MLRRDWGGIRSIEWDNVSHARMTLASKITTIINFCGRCLRCDSNLIIRLAEYNYLIANEKEEKILLLNSIDSSQIDQNANCGVWMSSIRQLVCFLLNVWHMCSIITWQVTLSYVNCCSQYIERKKKWKYQKRERDKQMCVYVRNLIQRKVYKRGKEQCDSRLSGWSLNWVCGGLATQLIRCLMCCAQWDKQETSRGRSYQQHCYYDQHVGSRCQLLRLVVNSLESLMLSLNGHLFVC